MKIDMKKEIKNRVRDLRNGDWYWIPKAVIQKAPKIRAAGIAVYNFLASLANKNQICFPSQKYISKSLGYSRSYINEVLKRLEKNKLIKIEKKGRYHRTYYLLELRCQPERTQVSGIANRDVNYTDTNNNKLTRININNNGNKNFLNFSSKGFALRTKEDLLALDLADELNDRKNLSLYLHCAKKYPEPFLRRVLGEVKEIPTERIKKSKAALFTYLVKKYAENKRAG